MFATAFLDLPPLQKAAGAVALPGSKSISNRVLLLAALSRGETVVHDLLDSDDTRVMLAALQQLGCDVQDLNSGSKRITGLGGKFAAAATAPQRIFLGNAGTAMRPLTAALALAGGEFELSGVPRMHERPIGDLVDALRQLGCRIDCTGQEGFPPLRIHPPQFIDGWRQRPIRVRGDVSSQFLTALLLALPLTAGEHDITIEVIGELISRPYIEITLNMLARFGVSVQREGWQRFTIAAGSRYQSPGEIHVEADASSASYFIAMGAMAATKEEPLVIQGLGLNSIQGDIRFVEAARAMGAQVQGDATSLRIHRGAWPLRAVDMDCNHIPDAAMTLAVMALFADGPCTLANIASWRVKETDRIRAVASECRRLGALVEEGEDWLRVHPLARGHWQAATIQTYDDHRMAMCFSLAAFNPDAQPVRIMDPKCVGKTFPEYFETLFTLASTAAHHIPVICIDGPSASGKGTLASALAAALGYHWLDSGALYRAAAIAAAQKGVALEAGNENALADIAARLPLHFEDARIFLDGVDVTDAIRSEAAGMGASRVSALPAVRNALCALQRSFRRLPGLVCDGRDMGTVIFPQADLKVFLTASAECRAQRRHKQLIFNGISANICDLRADLGARDARDASRAVAPLKPAQDALLLDSSGLTVEETVARVLQWWQARRPFAPEAA